MTNTRRIRIAVLGALAAAAALRPMTVRAMTLDRTMNLAELVRSAQTIVTGTVEQVSTGRTDGIACTEVRIRVSEALLGNVDGELMFRQLNLSSAMPAQNGRRYVGILPGMPNYRQGERVLLFLGPANQRQFRTTVGLEQGKFVFAGGSVQNETRNRGLFRDLPALPRESLTEKENAMLDTTVGAVGAGTLLGLVKRAVAEGWWSEAPPWPEGR